MAEEQRCQEGHRLCANNCGFFGSPATLNLCSKCYRDFHLKEEQASSAKVAVEKSLQPSSSSSSPAAVTEPSADARRPLELTLSGAEERVEASPSTVAAALAPASNRCSACKKKVGLTGFKCRCGFTHCGAHRYPEQHSCGFDFKAAGREAIARANPVVKADKLEKI